MRLLINGIPMLGCKTGIGHYIEYLIRELSRRPEIEKIGVFTGRDIVSPDSLFESLSTPRRSRRYERLRTIARWFAPITRPLVSRVRRTCFVSRTRDSNWTIYHEPNYAPLRFRGPIVTTVCDLAFLRYPLFVPKDRRQWLVSNLRRVVGRSTAVITISEFTRRELLELCPAIHPARVFTTALGVDTQRFNPHIPSSVVSDLRDRMRLPSTFILCLGTIEPRKNVGTLLKAYKLLPVDLQREFPLVLAGGYAWPDRRFRADIANLVRERRVIELGYVTDSDVPALVRAASVFCFPSFYEGFGLPPLEAAACGTPVVCSNTSSLPEVIGDAAAFVNPYSPDDIADGLLRALNDDALRDRLRYRGPARAASFSWAACAEATISAYRQAA
jgi:alpha-1,3-rhamnosyl/mannosyltransferase